MNNGLGLGVPFARRAVFDVASLFAQGQQGAWYEPSDFTTLFQGVAGSTPVTAVEQPVGLMRDKSGRGNHVPQATAAARPVPSARVNLLTKTDQFGDASWAKFNSATALGKQITFVTSLSYIQAAGATGLPQGDYNATIKVSCATTQTMSIDLSDAADGNPTYTQSIVVGPVPTTVTLAGNFGALFSGAITVLVKGNGTVSPGTVITVDEIAITSGLTATRYQRVNTVTDYDTVGFPHYLKLDGVDDGFTATIPAGGLTANMDCFIAIKRDAGGSLVALASPNLVDFFGVAQAADVGLASSGAGTPTFVVNGVAVPGGTGTTRAQLHTALPVSAFHILEVRNVNLSGPNWAGIRFGDYTDYRLNGSIASIVLCPAQTDSVRASIRRSLGAKVGLSL